MTPAVRILRRALFLPVNAAVDQERRLAETQTAAASAKRSHANACARLARRAVEIRALMADVIERNGEARELEE